MTKRKYKWKPDLPDHRDHVYSLKVVQRPSKTDLAPKLPPVFDQSTLGSCTGNALAGAVAFAHPGFMASRLMIYRNARVLEGTVQSDAGAQIRDVVKGMHQTGACVENHWPYDITKFAARPPQPCYEEAATRVITSYERVSGLDAMLDCLASGHPFIFGMSVYESFESDKVAKTGTLPMPKPTEKLLGGHAVLAVGYDLRTRRMKVRNSWGPGWGKKGHFTMPFDYISNTSLCDDFWVVRA